MSLGLLIEEHIPVKKQRQEKTKLSAITQELMLNDMQLQLELAVNDDLLTISDASTICQILGLNEEYQQMLENLTIKKRLHEDDLYYVLKHLENKDQELKFHPEDGMDELQKNLMQLGFTIRGAKALIKTLPVGLINLQSPYFWAERYLTNVFNYNPALAEVPTLRYPFVKDKTDIWFTENFSSEKRDEPAGEIVSCTINIFNSSNSSISIKLIEDYLHKAKCEFPDCLWYFHGTCHDHANAIISSGITLSSGRDNQDLSSGLYFSETLTDSKLWSYAGRDYHQAVLVFKIQKELINDNILDLTTDEEKWQYVVRLSRTTTNKDERMNVLKGIKVIRGFTCLNPKDVSQGKSLPLGFGESAVQLCVKDEEYLVKFISLKNIFAVLYF